MQNKEDVINLAEYIINDDRELDDFKDMIKENNWTESQALNSRHVYAIALRVLGIDKIDIKEI